MPVAKKTGGFLKAKHGGVPGWVILAGAGVAAWWLYNRSQSGQQGSGTADPTAGQNTLPHALRGRRGPRGPRGPRGGRGGHGGRHHG